MKILVLKSSGNKKGSSAILADELIRGAKERQHEIVEYSLTGKDIRPCRGCNACGMNGDCPVYNAGRCDLTVYLYRTTGWFHLEVLALE